MEAYGACLWTALIVILLGSSNHVTGFNLTILHTNDVHSRIEEINKYNGECSASDSSEGKCFGGMERMKTKIDEMRAKYPNSLLLDGGDQYQGTMFFYVHGGQLLSHFMNILGYDAMGLGNHEFDKGQSGLQPFVDNATFDVLSCNLDLSEAPELAAIKKSVTVSMSGEKVGIIGYTTTFTPIISKPEKVKFKDEIESIQAEVDRLTALGVDKIIAVGHAGFAKDKEIAQKVRGLDVVVGGHTNTFLYTGDAPSREEPMGLYPTLIKNVDDHNVLVVQDFAYGKYLGFLQVDFDENGLVTAWNGNPVLLDSSVSKDSEVTAAIEAYRPEVEKMKNEKVGLSLVHLEGDRTRCRVYECNMGNLIADSMVRENMRYADSMEWNHVAIALLNSGGIRAFIPKGDITSSHILSVLPFGNTVDIVDLTGQTIWDALEHSATYWVTGSEAFGGFLQVSGLRIVYDMRRPIGGRVVQAHALCADCSIPEFEPLNMTKVYKVLLTSFMLGGGDGYLMIKDGVHGAHTIGDLDSQLLLDYITENSPIAQGLDGRIQHLEDIEGDQYCVGGASSMHCSCLISVVVVMFTVLRFL